MKISELKISEQCVFSELAGFNLPSREWNKNSLQNMAVGEQVRVLPTNHFKNIGFAEENSPFCRYLTDFELAARRGK